MTSHSRRTAFRTRGRGLVLEALALILLLGLASPRRGGAATAPGVRELIPEFNSICAELEGSRRALAAGALGADAFVDRVLALFVRADSLSALLASRNADPRQDLASWTLDRSLRFLKSSLRENYVGIVGGNGYRFVSADLALRAAIAWRDGLTAPAPVAP